MKILLISPFFYPDEIGIALYNRLMVDYLLKKNHKVSVITSVPYYPEWNIKAPYDKSTIFSKENYLGATVFRVKQYVPKTPTAFKRVLQLMHFTILSFRYIFSVPKNSKIIVVTPFTSSIVTALLVRFFRGGKIWCHVQDFEFDAAVETLQLKLFKKSLFKTESMLFDSCDSVSVVCPSPVEWKIVVRAQVKSAGLPDAQGGDVATAQAVFLNRPLRRGDRIQSGDVELRRIDPLSSGSVFADPEDVIGRVLTQSITTHVPLMPRHLLREWAVEADDALSLVILRGGIEVISTGIALEAGQFGDTIRVLNATSGVELLGKVVGDKKVEIVSKSLR